MDWLNRMLGRDKETRSSDPSWSHISPTGGLPQPEAVHPRMAENLSTVLAAVGAISGSISTLPLYVYRLDGETREVAHDHPLMRLYRRGPNQHQSWADFAEWLVASTLLRGNGLAEVERDGSGQVTALVPIPWEWCSVHLLPTGRLAYDVTDGSGRIRRLLQDEVIHLRDRSDDGLIGRSRLHRAASTV